MLSHSPEGGPPHSIWDEALTDFFVFISRQAHLCDWIVLDHSSGSRYLVELHTCCYVNHAQSELHAHWLSFATNLCHQVNY